jgi:hypothetical protein
MLKDVNIEIPITNRNKSYFQNLNYKITGNTLTIKTTDLPKSSHIVVRVICDICHKEYSLKYEKYILNESRYGFFTCKKCSTEKKKITNLERYGVDNYAKIEGYGDLVKEINKEKHGNKNYNNMEKHKQTMLDKYGVDFYINLPEFRQKSKKTKKDKYGDENFINIEKVKKTKKDKYGDETFVNPLKAKRTNLVRYGVDNYTKTPEFKEKIRNFYDKKLMDMGLNIININREEGFVSILCNKGHRYDSPLQLLYDRINIKTESCLICNPLNSHTSSGYEVQLQDYLKLIYDDEIIYNSRKIIGKELDIYIPKLKLAFEFNGLYWHNELKVNSNYHLYKTELCEEKDIKLIQIYEDEWIYKKEIVKSKLLNLFDKSKQIQVKECEVKEIEDNDIIKEFLNENHILGYIDSKVKIGLYFKNILVSIMILGESKKTKNSKSPKDSYEILRFCNKLYINIIDGESFLLDFFIKKYSPSELNISIDRSWSNDVNLYEKIGFSLVEKIQPDYSYVIGNKKFNKFNFTKDILIKERFDPNKTEHEIMLERKIYRIYDSGQLMYNFKTKN